MSVVERSISQYEPVEGTAAFSIWFSKSTCWAEQSWWPALSQDFCETATYCHYFRFCWDVGLSALRQWEYIYFICWDIPYRHPGLWVYGFGEDRRGKSYAIFILDTSIIQRVHIGLFLKWVQRYNYFCKYYPLFPKSSSFFWLTSKNLCFTRRLFLWKKKQESDRGEWQCLCKIVFNHMWLQKSNLVEKDEKLPEPSHIHLFNWFLIC